MGLLDKLTSGQASATSLNGLTPTTPNFAQSTLHKTYSINGDPKANNLRAQNGILPQPSSLDINGVEPSTALNDPRYGPTGKQLSFRNGTYLDNLPS